MKLILPGINTPIDLGAEKVNTIVIENPSFLYKLVNLLRQQIEGLDGNAVLSDDGKILDFSKSIELLTQFVPFSLNQKNLITKLTQEFEKKAISSEYE